MNVTPHNPNAPSGAKKKRVRRGVVIVAVLVVIVLLSLAGYQYADMATSEYKASENAHKQLQARMYAESGVHYAMAFLGRPENLEGLAGSPFNNPGQFKDVDVKGPDGTAIGRFSIIAPPDPNDNLGAPLFGVTCEAGKINLNAMMQVDPSGTALFNMLKALPSELNLTDDIINSIIDWLGGTKNGGAANAEYMDKNYRARMGPIDSIDELLLVKGMTRDILYGTDVNRTGVPSENAPLTYPRGLSTFITVHSREQYRYADALLPFGRLPVFLNNEDLSQFYELFVEESGSEELAKFVVMYRTYNRSTSAPNAKDITAGNAVVADLSAFQLKFDRKVKTNLSSVYDLLSAPYVIVPVTADKKTINYYYPNPLLDPSKTKEMLPRLLSYGCLEDPTQKADRIPRININTASREVLLALTKIPGVTITETDVDTLIGIRPQLSATDGVSDIFQTSAWLLTEGVLDLNKLKAIEQYVTASSQVYRVQAIGQAFDGKGPAVRVEAIIDLNAGRPRIVTWRDLSDLGKGWTQPAQQ